jgi:hypothetical protein
VETNPYKPPAAAVRDPLPPPRSAVVAVLAGLAIDIGGGLMLGIVQGVVYAVMLTTDGMSPEQVQTNLTNPDPGSAYFVIGTLLGLGLSTLAGYVCARMVRDRERRVTGILTAISGVVAIAMAFAAEFDLELGIALTVIQSGCVMLGGELGRRRNAAQARQAAAAMAA